MNERKLLQVIDTLYETVLNDQALQPALTAIGSILESNHGTALSWNTELQGAPTPLTYFSSDPVRFGEVWEKYGAHYHQFDPTLAIAGKFSDGWFLDDRDLSRLERDKNPLLQELLRPSGFAGWSALEIKSGRDMWALSFEREHGQKPLTADQLEQMALVIPHLRRALTVRARMEDLRNMASIGIGALDNLSLPVWISEKDGLIRFENAAAQRERTRKSGFLTAKNSRLRFPQAADQAAFSSLLATASGNNGKHAGAMQIRQGAETTCIQVLPLSSHLAISNDWQRELVMVIAHSNQLANSGAILQTLYGFTPAETKIAHALTSGLTAEEIANSFLVKLSTVRTQIKSMLSKSECRRQTELVKLLTSLSIVRQSF